MTTTGGTDRLHALDAVRGFALLLGVFLHDANAYIPGMAGWLIVDDPSLPLSATFYVIHIFRMTTFYFMAGFFARMAFERKGGPPFVRDRLMRVLVPLVAAWIIVKWLMIGAVKVWGVSTVGGVGMVYEFTDPFRANGTLLGFVTGFPWAHLWFLYVLLVFYAIALPLRWVVNATGLGKAIAPSIDAMTAFLARSYIAPWVLAGPFVLVGVLRGTWNPWFGIPGPIFGLGIEATTIVGHGLAFGFGWLVHRQIDLIRIWERRWHIYLALAVAMTAACLWIIGPAPNFAPPTLDARTVAYAILYVGATWFWVFGVIGFALKFLSDYSFPRRYLADASYWIYLIHIPLVMAAHVVLFPFNMPSEVKYLLTLAAVLPIMLVTYQLLVRHTFIGVVLNGKRSHKPPHGDPPPAAQPPQASPAAG